MRERESVKREGGVGGKIRAKNGHGWVRLERARIGMERLGKEATSLFHLPSHRQRQTNNPITDTNAKGAFYVFEAL